MVRNIHVQSSTTVLTVDEVEKLQRQRIASFIGHVFHLTFAPMVDKLSQHPSQSTLWPEDG